MYLRSTGLGKTLLKAKVSNIQATNIVPMTLTQPEGNNEPTRLLMQMEILEPVHWTVRAFVEPPDLKDIIKILLKNPAIILWGLRFLVSKGVRFEQKDHK